MTEFNDIELFEVFEELSKNEGIDDIHKKTVSVDEALLICLDKFGIVKIEYISELCGLSADSVVEELKGAIFQNPEPFLLGEEYDITSHWVLSPKYLSGNVRKKLLEAEKANKKFPDRFSVNIERLKAVVPEKVDIDDIHIALGASWIPVEEVALFIKHFLNLKAIPEVYFYEDLLTYKIIPNEESRDSVLNTITYGVRGESFEYGSNHIKQYLTALEIIEQTMNAKTIKVFDYVPKGGWSIYEYEPVLNQAKTVEAQNKQKAIIDAFKDYVYGDRARTIRFEQYYNDKFVGYTYSQYDGSFLKLSDINPSVTLYKHQRDVVARVLLSDNNLLLAHDVGTGKTYEMIVSVHEMYRMGISRKNLIVVPNNVLKATIDAHKHLYKEDKILEIYPKDFVPANRNYMLERIRDGDYVAIYMAYSSFDMVVMSKDYYVDKMTREIQELNTAAYNTSVKHEKSKLKSKEEALRKKLGKYVVEERPCEWLTFDELGITTLVVDEAHNYKNIPIQTRADSIVGMGGSSKKCREMLEKAHYVQRLIFATGTPLTNSLADLFTFQIYLQPATLEYHKINTFDTWVNTFGQRETTIECDVDANSRSLRAMTRFSSFHNLSELMSLFSQVCDFHHLDESSEGLPKFNGHENICVPKNHAQHEYINGLSERTDQIRSKQVKRNEDNLLKVTTDGRLAALDIRLVECDVPYDKNSISKTDACAAKLLELYYGYPESVQVVFSDIGTPKAKFNIYDELASKLVIKGIPRHEIAFVHDATTESSRAKLFSAMNKGTVRIVIGSTQKLGVGVNVQERLVALHHLSVPWRPADMVQREGRILRKGNTSKEVFMYRYITEGSFDAYSWQLLENKQRFISSFLSGTSVAREIGDIADAVLSYAEVKALAIGNPLIKKRVEVSNKLERTKIAFRSRQREMQQLKNMIEETPEKLARLKKLSKQTRKDYEWYKGVKETVSNEERIAFGEELLEALRDNFEKDKERLFDDYQGFLVMLPANMSEKHPHIILVSEKGNRYYCEIDTDNKTPLGVTKSIDYVLEHLLERSEKLHYERELVKKQLSEAERDLKRENPYFEEIETIKKELFDIDSKLETQAKEVKRE